VARGLTITQRVGDIPHLTGLHVTLTAQHKAHSHLRDELKWTKVFWSCWELQTASLVQSRRWERALKVNRHCPKWNICIMIQRCWWHRTSLRQPTAVANGHNASWSNAVDDTAHHYASPLPWRMDTKTTVVRRPRSVLRPPMAVTHSNFAKIFRARKRRLSYGANFVILWIATLVQHWLMTDRQTVIHTQGHSMYCTSKASRALKNTKFSKTKHQKQKYWN